MSNQIKVEPTTQLNPEYDLEEDKNYQANIFDNNLEEIYGFSENQLGLRARTQPTSTLVFLPNDLRDVLQNINFDVLPAGSNLYDLGSPTRLWRGVYAQSYFTTGGAEVLVFKQINTDLGTNVVAGTLTDSLILTNTDGFIDITGDNGTNTVTLDLNATNTGNLIDAAITAELDDRLPVDTINRLSTTTTIDATSTGSTTLYTVPAGQTLIVDHIVIRCTSFVSGGKSVEAVASFGSNSPTFNDYLSSITYTIASADVFIRDSVENTAVVTHPPGNNFSIIIDTASDATTEEWSVDLFGYLI